MNLIKKWLPEAIAFPILTSAFFATRLTNIMSLPIFTDEAIYTRWAQIARFDSNWRFISLTDGKQPLFVWADMLLMKFFSDPLLSGRVVSTLSGLLAALGIYFLSYEIFKSKGSGNRIIALVAFGLTVFFPFLLVYDRLAIYESMTAALFAWSLYFQILLVRYLRLDIAMILGFILGGSVLTKSSGFLSIYMSPLLLLLIRSGRKTFNRKILKFVILSLVSIVIAYGIYSIQRLSPFFHIIEEKNSIFVYPVSEWLKFQHMDKVGNFISNFRGLFDWFVIYFTIPYAILLIYSFIVKREFLREKIFLLAWFLFPFLLLCIFGKTLYPRYILFMVLPLLPLVAYSIHGFFSKYKNTLVRVIFILIISFFPVRQMYYVVFDFANAPIPRLDLEQFVNGWPAGGGVSESVEYFREQSEKSEIFVATQGTFGLMPSSYEIYFHDNKNVSIKGYWPTNEQIPEEVLEIAKKKPTYFVFYQDCPICLAPGYAPESWPLREVLSVPKGIGPTKLTVYEVILQ